MKQVQDRQVEKLKEAAREIEEEVEKWNAVYQPQTQTVSEEAAAEEAALHEQPLKRQKRKLVKEQP